MEKVYKCVGKFGGFVQGELYKEVEGRLIDKDGDERMSFDEYNKLKGK